MLIFIVLLLVICNSHIIIDVCDQILTHAHFISYLFNELETTPYTA